ncbi:extracellular solute-binding protein, family 3 [[Synechococcus] sp. NIES-970]|nr:extracellular solute-binding protein, family 3 [[Synechococcus] sp. NIES-970]
MKNILIKSVGAIAFSFLGLLSYPNNVAAELAIDRIQRTGILRAGTNQDAAPFSFLDENGQFQGYSVEMLHLIRAQLEQELERPIQLELVSVSTDERIPKILTGAVDIICDASSYTWEREKVIDFSLTYAQTGTRLLLPRNSPLQNAESLAGRKIAVLAGTTNEVAIRQAHPEAKLVVVDHHYDGYNLLQRGAVDAFAADGILIDNWLQENNRILEFQAAEYFSKEGIACMLPENNSGLADITNYTLFRFIQHYLEGQEPAVTTFEKWFGDESIAPLTQDLRSLVLEKMELVIDLREAIFE